MIKEGDVVLFLQMLPVPHSKPKLRYSVGNVIKVENSFVTLIDMFNVKHTEYLNKVKLYRKVNSYNFGVT